MQYTYPKQENNKLVLPNIVLNEQQINAILKIEQKEGALKEILYIALALFFIIPFFKVFLSKEFIEYLTIDFSFSSLFIFIIVFIIPLLPCILYVIPRRIRIYKIKKGKFNSYTSSVEEKFTQKHLNFSKYGGLWKYSYHIRVIGIPKDIKISLEHFDFVLSCQQVYILDMGNCIRCYATTYVFSAMGNN